MTTDSDPVQLPQRRSKIIGEGEAADLISDGDTVAVGGAHAWNSPMSLIRALIRAGKRGLTLVPSPSAGMSIDLSIAGACVERVHVSYVGMEDLGLAPNFRRAAERGEIDIVEADEAWIIFGLRGGAGSLPFVTLPRRLYGSSDVPKRNPLIREVEDPYTGESVFTIPSIKPDVGILHAQVADQYGNALILGQRRYEDVMAKACKKVIVCADEVLDVDEPYPDPRLVTIPGIMVHAVVPLKFGAHPTGSPARYLHDQPHIAEYVEMCRNGRTEEYLDKYVRSTKNHDAYLDSIGGSRLASLLRTR